MGAHARCHHGRERRRCPEVRLAPRSPSPTLLLLYRDGAPAHDPARRAELAHPASQCGGSGLCIHRRQRNKCKECGGASICIHGRERTQCKECGGACICVHGRVRTQCKTCGGGSVCKHGRLRTRCKDCGGGGICARTGKRRSDCKDCRNNTHAPVPLIALPCAPVAPPPPQLLWVQVPPDVPPGGELRVQTPEGQTLTCTVPEGLPVGEVFGVECPALPPPPLPPPPPPSPPPQLVHNSSTSAESHSSESWSECDGLALLLSAAAHEDSSD